ncbi:hypothetical protein RF11_15437 [Thelohanellus kitauei]|uniref:Uncharacterized protein n=1 Tax=Thelohanellus kitauei TaxID=669202 RepID=A0A0C2MBQ8_THEKT|nr:hypothetical protein RF11_15437 [Thelohanellus kitauei]
MVHNFHQDNSGLFVTGRESSIFSLLRTILIQMARRNIFQIEGDVVRHQNQLKPRMPFYSECQQEKTQLSYVPNYNNEDAPNVNTRPDPRRSAILEEKRLKKARGGEGIYILIRLKCAYSLFYSIVVDILATNF